MWRALAMLVYANKKHGIRQINRMLVVKDAAFRLRLFYLNAASVFAFCKYTPCITRSLSLV